MLKWEYIVVRAGRGSLSAVLKEYGFAGWELVETFVDDDEPSSRRLIFKRPMVAAS